MSLIHLWIDPYGKEFRPKISTPGLVEADVADVIRIRGTDVEALVEKPLRRIGVRIDHDRGVLNGTRLRADLRIAYGRGGLARLSRSQRARQRGDKKGSNSHSWGPDRIRGKAVIVQALLLWNKTRDVHQQGRELLRPDGFFNAELQVLAAGSL